ncbi:hypothetical protein BDN72DRAFT_862388 [Pluteus cervinus]|uniref:Uncharacterized protein n=1 Tax=Pluteus cervinus TaxID=181527 RepID=A0ACD3ABD8_9AGAR|nr:hypothetical protein BDN72DRAFT_862388 [Pluteus cervinus]
MKESKLLRWKWQMKFSLSLERYTAETEGVTRTFALEMTTTSIYIRPTVAPSSWPLPSRSLNPKATYKVEYANPNVLESPTGERAADTKTRRILGIDKVLDEEGNIKERDKLWGNLPRRAHLKSPSQEEDSSSSCGRHTGIEGGFRLVEVEV